MGTSWYRILMYHSICRLPEDPVRICTSLGRLEAHMRCLKRRNLRGVSMRELRRAESRGDARGLVGITFDDAYEDFLLAAVPVLERMGFSATVFAPSNFLSKGIGWEWDKPPKPRLRLLGEESLRK